MKSSGSQGAHYTGQFRISTYLPAGSVTRLLATDEDVLKVIAGLKDLQVEHVFLELFRGGHAVEESVLVRARDMIRQAGIDVGAALTTTWGEGFGRAALPQPDEQGFLFCYSDPETVAVMTEICERAGRLFDELILDDYFFTNCECDNCYAAKGDRPWGAFRNELLADFAAGAILAPAHRANPNCKVIIKYPQWYDRFHQFGYDIDAQTKQFDAIWIGTETRNPKGHQRSLSFCQQTQSWSGYNWMHDIGGEKALGGWFDPYNCDEISYVEQAYQNALIGTPEMLLFNYDSLMYKSCLPLVAAFKDHLPAVRAWSAALRGAKPFGLACYKPPNSFSQGEAYVFDYVTMFGIPTTMHATFPTDAPVVFLPAHALADSDIVAKLRTHIESGRSVLASAEFLAGLESEQLVADLFGLAPRKAVAGQGPTYTRRVRMGDEQFHMRRYVDLNGALETLDAEVLVSWGACDRYAPYFTRKRHGRAAAMMLDTYTSPLTGRARVNIDRWVNSLELPQPVLDCISNAVTEPLGLQIRCPGRVAVYCFAAGPLAICNYLDEPAEVRIDLVGDSPLGSLDRFGPVEPNDATIGTHTAERLSVTLPARSRVLFATKA